jgi:hypothetical protein
VEGEAKKRNVRGGEKNVKNEEDNDTMPVSELVTRRDDLEVNLRAPLALRQPAPSALAHYSPDQLMALAESLAESKFLPAGYAGNTMNCWMALDLAARLRVSPFLIIQGCYPVNGRMSWMAKPALALCYERGVFLRRVRYRIRRKKNDELVTAYTLLNDGGPEARPIAETVSYSLAEAEGWTKNSKYTHPLMRTRMLKHRALTFLITLNTPEVLHGGGFFMEDLMVAHQKGQDTGLTDDEVFFGALLGEIDPALTLKVVNTFRAQHDRCPLEEEDPEKIDAFLSALAAGAIKIV